MNQNWTASVAARASGFSGAFVGVNGQYSLSTSPIALIQHAMSAGLQFASSQPVPVAFHKAMAVASAVDFTAGRLERTSYYPQLVQSEKANISYWLGMAFAQYQAEQILGVSQLIHVQTLINRGVISLRGGSRRQPDLAGIDAASVWHVIEAKGRSNPPSRAQRSAWKQQAGAVTFNGGNVPGTRSYSLAIVGRPYRLELVDPPPDEGETTFDLEVDLDSLREAYYEPYANWLQDTRLEVSISGASYLVKRAGYDSEDGRFVFVGVASNLLNRMPPRELVEARSFAVIDSEHAYVGPNGVAIFKSLSGDVVELLS